MLFRTYNMERGIWACELDSFFLFMAYLSFAYLFSLMITVIVEKPSLNMIDTFILGTDREVYLRSPAGHSTGKTTKSVASSLRINGGSRSLSDESGESDAETLDKSDEQPAFAAAYNKGRSDLVLDPEESIPPSVAKKPAKVSSIKFPTKSKNAPPE